jgi:uncharacterized protein (UPF0261 family)
MSSVGGPSHSDRVNAARGSAAFADSRNDAAAADARADDASAGAGARRSPCVLIIGTADTKADELLFLKQRIEADRARVLVMDVGVLGAPSFAPDVRNADVAAAAGSSLQALARAGDENSAMTCMAAGAAHIARELHAAGRIDGVLALGGTMGTDLALDVTAALPLGVPKMIVTTIAYSHLIPPERLAPDLMMVLWAGGLYGLNDLCRSTLAQAAGALVGACRAAASPAARRPRVAITSLGKSCVSYMVRLVPALELRGYEPVVFHCTGMGGRAMEALIAERSFVAVFDFTLQEVVNHLHGSVVSAGPDRLLGAARLGVPQLVAPGASDMIDLQAWASRAASHAARAYHAHNRLIGSVSTTAEERRALAREVCERLAQSTGPVTLLLPRRGLHEWDRAGGPMHDPDAHAALLDEFRRQARPPVELHDLDLHINDDEFVDHALRVFDGWVSAGLVPPGAADPPCTPPSGGKLDKCR